jgi:hypothetical protein
MRKITMWITAVLATIILLYSYNANPGAEQGSTDHPNQPTIPGG